jgi:hypothetical protein
MTSSSRELSEHLLRDPESGVVLSSSGETKASRSLGRLRRVMGSLSLLDLALVITLVVAGRQAAHGQDGAYSYRSTVEDLVVLSVIRAAIVIVVLSSTFCSSSSSRTHIEDLDLAGDRALAGQAALIDSIGPDQSRDGGLPMWLAFYTMIIAFILTAGMGEKYCLSSWMSLISDFEFVKWMCCGGMYVQVAPQACWTVWTHESTLGAQLQSLRMSNPLSPLCILSVHIRRQGNFVLLDLGGGCVFVRPRSGAGGVLCPNVPD